MGRAAVVAAAAAPAEEQINQPPQGKVLRRQPSVTAGEGDRVLNSCPHVRKPPMKDQLIRLP